MKTKPYKDYEFFNGAKKKCFEFAKRSRNEPTQAEILVWEILKSRKLIGFKFRRQHVFANFILDFYCHEAKLALEIDGGYHQSQPGMPEKDAERDKQLLSKGIKTLRFTNQEVFNDIEEVRTSILIFLVQVNSHKT